MAGPKYVDQVKVAAHQWSRRHEKIRDWRDIRYGRDDVLSTIPEELRATDFEYHSMDLDEAVHDMAAFMSGSQQTWTVNPPKDREARRADDIESVLATVFGPNGTLESEAGGDVSYMVWQNQVEPAGQGIYKLTLKRDYPLRMPQRKYSDDDAELEENPDYKPTSKRRKDSTDQTKYRESDESLGARRQKFMEDEFPWQWRSVDPIHYFEITQDGVVVCAGEIAARSVARLSEKEKLTLDNLGDGFVLSGPDSDGNSSETVNCIEYWTATDGYFCFMAAESSEGGDRALEEARSWSHPYGRVPYYHANGLMTNDKDIALRYSGAFTKLLSEISLLNHLETMHFNAIHRGYFPMYYPIKDVQAGNSAAPMEAEQLVAVTQADMERTELPPGWKWEVMPSGFEPDLTYQLQAARERVRDSAIASVLAGRSAGAGDSGAKISLLINAATRNIDPFRLHHQGAYKQMAETMLRCSKKLKLDLNVSIDTTTPEGTRLVKALSLKSSDIVSTAVEMQLNVKLPVDEAAGETRGLTLVQANMMSYQQAAPRFFGVGDPTKEKERIAIERREIQIDDIAFQTAATNFQSVSPSYFAEFMQNVEPLAAPPGTAGGGPQGVYGGAATMLGRGQAAMPSASQVDMGGMA